MMDIFQKMFNRQNTKYVIVPKQSFFQFCRKKKPEL